MSDEPILKSYNVLVSIKRGKKERMKDTPMYFASDVDKAIAALRARIAELEREREALMEAGMTLAQACTEEAQNGEPLDKEFDAVAVFMKQPNALARWMSREAK